jgi:hypothetical protein
MDASVIGLERGTEARRPIQPPGVTMVIVVNIVRAGWAAFVALWMPGLFNGRGAERLEQQNR